MLLFLFSYTCSYFVSTVSSFITNHCCMVSRFTLADFAIVSIDTPTLKSSIAIDFTFISAPIACDSAPASYVFPDHIQKYSYVTPPLCSTSENLPKFRSRYIHPQLFLLPCQTSFAPDIFEQYPQKSYTDAMLDSFWLIPDCVPH